jgi:hypothetical protein
MVARVWDEDSISQAITTALETGKAIINFTSHRDAENFRNAIYNYRRARDGIGNELAVEVRNTTVVIQEKRAVKSPLSISTKEPE